MISDFIFFFLHPEAAEVQRVIRKVCKVKISLQDSWEFWDYCVFYDTPDQWGEIPAAVRKHFWLWAYGDGPFEPTIIEDERP